MLFSNVIKPGNVVAVGDIHGRADLLSEFVDWVADSGAHIVFLGDLIDRGPADFEVLEIVQLLREHPQEFGLASVTVLRGNHEQMMLDAAAGRPLVWIQNGGNFADRERIFRHVSWVKDLPLYQVMEGTLFVHAGIDPDYSMADQDPDDLIWIREPFLHPGLSLSTAFPLGNVKQVVHGHTPWPFDEYRQAGFPTRVNIDSMAFDSGVLTAFNVTTQRFWQLGDVDFDEPVEQEELVTV
jgi:serine/threonine protein phosphatase 1